MLPILVTPLPMVTLVRLLQYLKDVLPIDVTLFGILRLVTPVILPKAKLPILVTLLPMFMLVAALQLQNPLLLMLVTLSGIVMLVRPVQ